jgi:hypothetical protein
MSERQRTFPDPGFRPGDLAFERSVGKTTVQRRRRPRASTTAAHRAGRIDVLLPAGERVEVRTRTRFTRDAGLMSGEVTIDGQRVFACEWHEVV